MKLWDFIVKHEFWFSCLVIISLWIAEDQTGQWWIGFLATLVLVTAFSVSHLILCGRRTKVSNSGND